MSLEEFDVEKYINYEKAGSREDGIAEGRVQGENDIMSIMGAIRAAISNGIYDCANIAAQFGRSASEIESIRNLMIL